tara:strand:- start:93 stop:737 length:645 start_codon:yes stop_codon:yes gene_type:complete
MKEQWNVTEIPRSQTHQWILKKHYAKRLPMIKYAFGLYNETVLVGVCTFGHPPNYNFNDGKFVFDGYKCLTLELNRLVVNDGLPPNTLSFFVSRCLKKLPTPSCVVSYADPNNGHHGYIYQATNWIYTGVSNPKHRYIFEDGSAFDVRRGIDKKGKIVDKILLKPTHRYIYLNGNKRDLKEMISKLKVKRLPYPKGQNINYDTSDNIVTQGVLF